MKYLTLKTLLLAVTVSISSSAFAGLVNINKADSEALAHHLTGIGASKAEAIVAYRKEHGAFSEVKDLVNVKGIGKGILKKNLEDLSLTDGAIAMLEESKKKVKEEGLKKVEKVDKKPVVLGKNKVTGKLSAKIAEKKKEKVAQLEKNKQSSKIKSIPLKGSEKTVK